MKMGYFLSSFGGIAPEPLKPGRGRARTMSGHRGTACGPRCALAGRLRAEKRTYSMKTKMKTKNRRIQYYHEIEQNFEIVAIFLSSFWVFLSSRARGRFYRCQGAPRGPAAAPGTPLAGFRRPPTPGPPAGAPGDKNEDKKHTISNKDLHFDQPPGHCV